MTTQWGRSAKRIGLLETPEYKAQLLETPEYKAQLLGTPEYKAQLLGTTEYKAQLLGTPEYKAQLLGTMEYKAQLLGTPEYKAQLLGTMEYKAQLFNDDITSIELSYWRWRELPKLCRADRGRIKSIGHIEAEKQEASRPNKLHCKRKYILKYSTPKHTPNKHVEQVGCETSEKYLRKWLKTWIIVYFGAQSDPEIGPLRPIFNTPLKVAQIDMYTKTETTDVKPVEHF